MDDFVATEAPVIDSTPLDTAVEASLDTSTDTTVDTPEHGVEQPEAEPIEEGQKAGPFRAVENGKLQPDAKAYLEKLKAENPRMARAVERALFAEDRLRRELPGGFKEVSELRTKIEELGGPEGIQEMTGELGSWREFDQMYTAADPKILEFFTETPQAAAAFQKIAPMAFEKYREIAPEAYSSYIAQVFSADLAAEGIPLALERLQDFIPADQPRAKQVLDSLINYVNRIGNLAKQQPKAPAAPNAPDNKAADSVKQREMELTRKEWRGESDSAHTSLFQKAWKEQIGARKLSQEQVDTVRELYGLRLQAIGKEAKDFNKKVGSYFSAGQKDGYLRYMQSFYADAVPRALRSAIARVVPSKPGPKPEVPGKAAVPGTPAAGKAPAGFAQINAKPKMGEVDNTQTTGDMWLSGKAVLKDGRKVFWK